MNARILQLVALAGSFLLVLPPGWCSAFVGSSSADSVAVTCCQPAQVSPPDSAPSTPVPPESDCCCDRAATPVSRTTTPSDSLAAALPLASAAEVMPTPGLSGLQLSTDGDFRSSLRLHVLQCVWLC